MLWILILFVGSANSAEIGNTGSRCFDCNYAPSGHVMSSNGWQVARGTGEVGTQYCALQAYGDSGFIDKLICKSGQCFIRQDNNGMVYRGCADEENLPWGVETVQNCAYQGSGESLWWFCDGDLCNDGQLGEDEDRCGDPPEDEGFVYGTNDLYEGQDLEYYADDTTQYKSQEDYLPANDRSNSNGPVNYLPEPHQDRYQPEVDSSRTNSDGYQQQPNPAPDSSNGGYAYDYYYPQGDNTDKHDGVKYNPCDGSCAHNPSGLFSDLERPDHFIQCGSGSQGGNPCVCCKPFYLVCPLGTLFDNKAKVCTISNNKYK